MEFAGRKVGVVGQGTWQMGDAQDRREEEIRALRRGVELGMAVIDTAEMYGGGRSEELVGEAIAPIRDEVFLVSKVLPSNASRHGTRKACEASLRRLGVERLDCYLLHWEGDHPIAETVSAFEDLRQAGKIHSWGVSNLDVRSMEEMLAFPRGEYCATDQVLYNPQYRGVEFDLLPWCARHRMPVMAYSPVGQGGELLRSPVLGAIAARHGVSTAQVALAWGLRAGVMVIPKAGSVEHVEENAAAGRLQLTEQDVREIDMAFPVPRSKQRLAML